MPRRTGKIRPEVHDFSSGIHSEHAPPTPTGLPTNCPTCSGRLLRLDVFNRNGREESTYKCRDCDRFWTFYEYVSGIYPSVFEDTFERLVMMGTLTEDGRVKADQGEPHAQGSKADKPGV